jgi:hypothetical protein
MISMKKHFLMLDIFIHHEGTKDTKKKHILDMGTDCGFCPPLPAGEGWGEGSLKSAIHDRLQYRPHKSNRACCPAPLEVLFLRALRVFVVKNKLETRFT